MSSSIIHDNICSLIHEMCQSKSYHSDTKYHIKLNIIFSVVTACTSHSGIHELHIQMGALGAIVGTLNRIGESGLTVDRHTQKLKSSQKISLFALDSPTTILKLLGFWPFL